MIIPVDRASLPQAATIHALSWQASHRSFCTPDFVAQHTPERQLKYLLNKLAGGSALYMLIEDVPVGIVSVTGSLIEDLYVLPEYQNRGCGTQLLQYAIERCASAPTLWILENNTDAERLYRRMGFEPTGNINIITDRLSEIEFILKQ